MDLYDMDVAVKKSLRFHSLDSFRGIFAVFVVLFHLRALDSITETDFFRNAELFVDFFFVLSGFVMAHSYGSDKNLNIKKYVISRTFRLLPLHVVMLLVFIGFEFLKVVAQKKGLTANNEPFTGYFAVSEILPNLLLIQSWTTFTEKLSFNYPSWSVSVEYYMYIVFGLVMVFAFKIRKYVWFAIALITIFMLSLDVAFVTDVALKGLACFFTGAITYATHKKIINNFKMLAKSTATFVELLSVLLVFYVVVTDIEYKYMFSLVVFAWMVFVFSFDRGLVSDFLSMRIFEYLGRISFSIYLTHAAILFLYMSGLYVFQKVFKVEVSPLIEGVRYLDVGSAEVNNLAVLLVLLSVVWVSGFTYRHIELKGQMLGKGLSATYEVRRSY